MYFLILTLLAVVLLLIFLRILIKADIKNLARILRFSGAGACFLIGAFLTLAGRFVFAVPFILAGFAILGKTSALTGGFPWGQGRKTAQQNSRVRTSLIEMMLDHDSGQMDGRVLAGEFEARELNSLDMDELGRLYDTALEAADQSADLLETYLDRQHPGWAEHPAFAASAGKARSTSRAGGPMSREEALEVLGLISGASEVDIRNAHKSLMKKIHPDQGGSGYLASKINEAKDCLLGE